MGKRTEQSKKVYNEMAWKYESAPEGNYTRPHKEEIIKKIVLRDGDKILDVACGTGYLLGELSKKARVSAFGVDISENMVAAARERYPACTFAVGSCIPLRFADESMDVITVSCAFHHFETPKAFANECMRVLKKNGKLYIAEPFIPPVVRWFANMVIVPFSKKGDVRVYDQRELQLFFELAGFIDMESYTAGTVLFFSARKKNDPDNVRIGRR